MSCKNLNFAALCCIMEIMSSRHLRLLIANNSYSTQCLTLSSACAGGGEIKSIKAKEIMNEKLIHNLLVRG